MQTPRIGYQKECILFSTSELKKFGHLKRRKCFRTKRDWSVRAPRVQWTSPTVGGSLERERERGRETKALRPYDGREREKIEAEKQLFSLFSLQIYNVLFSLSLRSRTAVCNSSEPGEEKNKEKEKFSPPSSFSPSPLGMSRLRARGRGEKNKAPACCVAL